MTGVLRVARTIRRNRSLARVATAYGLFVVTQYAVWIGMLIYAYGNGGATTAGLVALAQLVPAVLVAPLAATVADRKPPVRLLTTGFAVQAVGMSVTALAIWVDSTPYLAYGAAVIASTAVATTRPAQAPLAPALARSPDELTAANVALGWMESAGIVVAGLATGLLVAAVGVWTVFLTGALLILVSIALVARLRTPPVAITADHGVLTEVAAGLSLVRRSPRPRLLVTLLTAQWVVIGALDVLFVVVAVDVLGRGDDWVGYLNTAYGVGGVAAGAATAMLVGRKLGKPILAAGAALSAGLALTAVAPSTGATVLVLALAGAGRAVFDVATRTMLQRSVPTELVGRVFGLVEGLAMAGVALGSVLVPALVALGGNTAALLGVAALLPALGLVSVGRLLRLDDEAFVPVTEIALLRSLRLFAQLPAPELETLARSLQRRDVDPGSTVIRQGDAGDRYYVLASGAVAVSREGQDLGTRHRGDGVGEIALLHEVPRTATVVATEPTTLYALDREPFLSALAGNHMVSATADAIAAERLADEDPRSRG